MGSTRTLKSVLLTYSKMRQGVFDCGSRTMSSRRMMLVPPARFCRILISRLIFFFLTGLRILMITLVPVATCTRSSSEPDGARVDALLVDQGGADGFLDKELRPDLLRTACDAAGIDLTLTVRDGYDHSYYFISTFMADHLRWHGERLGQGA